MTPTAATQKPRYIETVHSVMSEAYPDQFKLTVDEFEQKLSSNPKYVETVYSVMSEAYPDQFKLTQEDFGSKLAVKKKEPTQGGFVGNITKAVSKGLEGQQPQQQERSEKVTESDLSQFKQDYGVQESPKPISAEEAQAVFSQATEQEVTQADLANIEAPKRKTNEDFDYEEAKEITDFYRGKPQRTDRAVDEVGEAFTGVIPAEGPRLAESLRDYERPKGLTQEEAEPYRKEFFARREQAILEAEKDYTNFLAHKGDEYSVNKWVALKEKGKENWSISDQRFMRQFQTEALNAVTKVEMAKIYEIKQVADVDAYEVGAAALNAEINKLNEEFKALGLKGETPEEAIIRQKAAKLAKRSEEVNQQYEALGIKEGQAVDEITAQKANALVEESEKLHEEYNALGIKEEQPKDVATRKKAEALVQKSKELNAKFEALKEQTGFTDELQAEYEKAANGIATTRVDLNPDFADVYASDQADTKEIQANREKAMSNEFWSNVGVFFEQIPNSVTKNVVGLANLPKTLWDVTGDTSYGFADELYDGTQELLRDIETQTSAGDNRGLPSAYKYSKLIGDAVGSIATFATGGSGAVTKVGRYAATATTAFLVTQDDYYKEALEAGMTPQEASAVGMTLAAITGSLEGLIPDSKYFASSPFRKSIINAVMSGKPVSVALKEALQAAPASALSVFKSGVKEGVLEEGSQTLAEDLTKTVINSLMDTEMETFNPETYKESIIAGFAAGGGMSVLSRPQPKSPITEQILMDAVRNPEQTIAYVPAEQQEQVKTQLYEAAQTLSVLEKHPNWERLTPAQQNHVLSEVLRKKQLEATAKGIGVEDESIATEVGKIDAEVGQILSGKPIEQEKVEAVPDTPSPEVELEPVDTRQPVVEEVEPVVEPVAPYSDYYESAESSMGTVDTIPIEVEQTETVEPAPTQAEAVEAVTPVEAEVEAVEMEDGKAEVVEDGGADLAMGEVKEGEATDYFVSNTGKHTVDKQKNIDTASRILSDLGLSAQFTGYSDTNGVSVYFQDSATGKKIRVSDHSVKKPERITEEVLLSFDKKTMGVGGKTGVLSNFKDNKKEADLLLNSIEPKISTETETVSVGAEPTAPKPSDKWRTKAKDIRGASGGALNVLPNLYATALEAAADVYDAAIAAGKSIRAATKAARDEARRIIGLDQSDEKDKADTLAEVEKVIVGEEEVADEGEKRVHSFVDALINRSDTTSKKEKKKLGEDISSQYAVMSFDKIDELGQRIVDELGGLDEALAEARKKDSSIPIALQSFVFGQAIIKAREELKKAKAAKDNKALDKWSDYSNEAAQDLADKATAFGQYNAYIQQFYENSAIAVKRKIKKALEEVNKIEAPKAKRHARELLGEIQDMSDAETDLETAIDNLDDFRVKELEAKVAELEKRLKEAKSPQKAGKKVNLGVSKEAFDAAMKRMMSAAYSNPFGNPEFIKDAAIISVYAIEQGVRKFADFAKFMAKYAKGKYKEYYGEWYKEARERAVEAGLNESEFNTDSEVDVIVEEGRVDQQRLEAELEERKKELETARKTREFGRLLSIQVGTKPRSDKVKKLKELAAELDRSYGGTGFSETAAAYEKQKQIDKSLSPSGINQNIRTGLIEAGYVKQVGGKDQVDWKKIVEGEKDPQAVADKLEKALQGKVPQYAIDAAKRAVIDTIVDKKKKAVNAFIKGKRRVTARRALGRARRSGNIDKLLKLWKEGGLNDQDVLSILADDFGAEEISTEEEGRLDALVEAIDAAPLGSAEREKLEEELQAFLHSIGEGWIGKTFWDQMRSRMLSGPITFVKNLTGTMETAVMLAQQFLDSNLNTSVFKGDVDANVLKVFKKAQGIAAAAMIDIVARGGVDMGTAFSEITQSKEGSPRVRYLEYIRQRGRTLPDFYVKGMNLNVYNFLTDNEKFVGRGISAPDTWNQIILQEISSYNFIKRRLLLNNPNMSSKTAAKQAMEVMYGKDINEARQEAEAEFKERGIALDLDNVVDLARFNRRVNEIVVQARGKEVLQQSQYFANRYTFKTADAGIASLAGEVAARLRQSVIPSVTAHFKQRLEAGGHDKAAKRVAKFGENVNNAIWDLTMPFIKGVANIKEKGLEYFPMYGVAKTTVYGVKGTAERFFGNKEKASDSFARMREYQFRAAVGYAFLLMAAAWADDDEEEGKALYATGTGDFRRDVTQQRERKDMTLRTKSGKDIPFEAFGAAAEALKIRALWEDYKRYNPDYEGDSDFVSKLIAGVFYDNYTENLGKMIQGDLDLKRMSAEFVSRALLPFAQTSRQAYQIMNDQSKRPISWLEHLAKYSGLVAGWSLDRPAFDYRGKEYNTADLYSNSVNGFVKMLATRMGADEIDRFVMKYHPSMVTIGQSNKDYEILENDGVYQPMDDLQYYEFKLEKAKNLNKFLTEYYNAQPEENVKVSTKLTDVQYEKLRKEVLKTAVHNGEKLDMNNPDQAKIVDDRIMAMTPEFKLKNKIKDDITEINTHATRAAYEKLLLDQKKFVPLNIRGYYGTTPDAVDKVLKRKEFKMNPSKSVTYE